MPIRIKAAPGHRVPRRARQPAARRRHRARKAHAVLGAASARRRNHRRGRGGVGRGRSPAGYTRTRRPLRGDHHAGWQPGLFDDPHLPAGWRLSQHRQQPRDRRPVRRQLQAPVFGQKLAAGTATRTRSCACRIAAGLFGLNSMLHIMMQRIYDQSAFLEVWAVPVSDLGGGVLAAGSVKVATAPTASGVLCLYIGGERVTVGVTAGQTAAQVATAIQAAVAAIPRQYVTAAIDGEDTSKVNLTALHKGECYNSIDIRHSYYRGEALPAGMTLTIVAMTGGTGNPDMTAAIAAHGADALGEDRHALYGRRQPHAPRERAAHPASGRPSRRKAWPIPSRPPRSRPCSPWATRATRPSCRSAAFRRCRHRPLRWRPAMPRSRPTPPSRIRRARCAHSS